MRFNAVFFAFMPWIVFGLSWRSIGLDASITQAAPMWIAISPIYTLIALFITYREGQQSCKGETK